MVSEWNSLPCDVVKANFVKRFKALFDDYIKDIFVYMTKLY